MGLEEQIGQFQSVLGRCFWLFFFPSDTVVVTTVKVGLIVCGFELAGLDESS